jgi:uracil-DNA glycosylase
MEKPKLDEIKQKLYEKLKPSGWADKLKGFLLSSQMDDVLKTLESDVMDGNRFTPVLKNVFKAFEECKYSDLKVVIISQDPYCVEGQATGIAFDCSGHGVIQPSLQYIFDEIVNTIHQGKHYNQSMDLKRWSNQGILLLNCALTTTIGKIGRHYLIWQPFMAYLLDILGCYNPGIIYIFMGLKAKEWSESIPDNNYKLYTTHPATAHYNKGRWNCNNCFVETNKILMKTNSFSITW